MIKPIFEILFLLVLSVSISSFSFSTLFFKDGKIKNFQTPFFGASWPGKYMWGVLLSKSLFSSTIGVVLQGVLVL